MDSLIIGDAGTMGAVQVSTDAHLLVVAVEPSPRGAITLYDIENPASPQSIPRDTAPDIINGGIRVR